jgi:hypothetical protein
VPARGQPDARPAAREHGEGEEGEAEQGEPEHVVRGRRERLTEHARLRHHEPLGAA